MPCQLLHLGLFCCRTINFAIVHSFPIQMKSVFDRILTYCKFMLSYTNKFVIQCFKQHVHWTKKQKIMNLQVSSKNSSYCSKVENSLQLLCIFCFQMQLILWKVFELLGNLKLSLKANEKNAMHTISWSQRQGIRYLIFW